MSNEERKDIIIGEINQTEINDELKVSFLDYSMSVITSRALPDVRDGLKPIHRRIIYSMSEIGLTPNKPYKKSAKIVGDVIAKYHPHGDNSVYQTIVRMAQNFNYRYELIDGQGNFGSVDGDSAAAMRYTEARMTKISSEILRDIEFETVNYQENYDGSEKEPMVLPCRIPNLLINGSIGIAVGMATSIPPHNLNEIIDATIYLIKEKKCEPTELLQFIKGPDFPLGGNIFNTPDLKKIYLNGAGFVTNQATIEIEKDIDGNDIAMIIKDIPYMTNKASIIKQIAVLMEQKVIKGISDIRDESNRFGIRIYIELKKNAFTNVILKNLYKHTSLQTKFHAKMIAIFNGGPKENLNVKQILQYYINHQIEIITRKIKYIIKQDTKKLHILKGLIIANKNIDEIIKIIKKTGTHQEITIKLQKKFNIDQTQAKAILNMRLSRLSSLESKQIIQDAKKLDLDITENKAILESKEKINDILITDLLQIKENYGDARRTTVIEGIEDINQKELIIPKPCIISITKKGYVKSVDVTDFKIQARGGVGVKGLKLYKDDSLLEIIHCKNTDQMLVFSEKGRVYKIFAYDVPEYARTARGVSLSNIIEYYNKNKETGVSAFLPLGNDIEDKDLLFLTKKGIIKKMKMTDFKSIYRSGKLAINTFKHKDSIVTVSLVKDDSDILIATNKGKVVRIKSANLKNRSRISYGVKGIKLAPEHKVAGMASSINGNLVFTISEKGYGKASPISLYRSTKRGASGVLGLKISKKTGDLVNVACVNKTEKIIITTNKGKTIQIELSKLNTIGRNTVGVKMVSLKENDKINSFTISRE